MVEERIKTRFGKEKATVSTMAKTLIYIPRMFTRKEFKEFIGYIPENFDRTVNEFWDYVNEKLKAVSHRIRFVYSDSFPKGKEKSLSQDESAIVEDLARNGARLKDVGDPALAAEMKAWLEMAKTSPNQVILELHEESSREMSKNIMDAIVQTLKKGEMGVLFIDPSLNISFPKDLKVIRMFPFDPRDYLKRHHVRLRK